MTRKRAAIAIFFGCVFVAGGFLFANRSEEILQDRFEQAKAKLKAKRDAGQLLPEWRDVDLDKLTMDDVGIKVTAWDEWQIGTGRWLSRRWYLWVPLVFAACLAIEWFEVWLVSRWK